MIRHSKDRLSLVPLLAVLTWLSLPIQAGAAPEGSLDQFLKSPDPTVALGWAQAGGTNLTLLIHALNKGGRPADVAAWALARHPRPEAAPALRTHLLSVDQVAGYYAARSLGRLPHDPENVQALGALLPDQTNGFWELSSGGVGRLRDAWDDQRRRYHEAAPAGMANLRVAYAAMEALGELGGETAAALLRRALTNDQYLIRYGALRALARMGHVPSSGVIQELSQHDPVLLVRLAAEQALLVLRGELPAANLYKASPIWGTRFSATPASRESATASEPSLPQAIAFIKTPHRSEATLGFRDSYFFPKTPRYHSGENLYVLSPPRPDGTLRNLTQLSHGEIQGPEVSQDGSRLLFAMRRNRDQDGFHIFEIGVDGAGLRQLTDGNCNDVDPCYLPDGRIAFCSDRAGWQEYYHQERSRVIHVMNADGSGIETITFNPNQDYDPLALRDGRILYSSYRFYAQDGSEGPLPGEHMGLARIETVLRACYPDGSGDHLFYGSMRGGFYAPMRPMPFSDQFAGWHGRGYHVGVSVSQQRELDDGRILCTTPAGLTLILPDLAPLDCEIPLYPEVVNLAGGEEVYIHNYDHMNPVGRFTTPFEAHDDWIWVSHAPWHDLRVNGYGLYLLNLATRELRLVYDDPNLSDVDPIPLTPRAPGRVRTVAPAARQETGFVLCNSVFNTDQPFQKEAARYVRVLEGIQMGHSINANASFRTRILGTVPLHSDGSFFLEVPANVPIRFDLLDEDGRMLIHETAFNYIRPGEMRGCTGCHEDRKQASPNNRPAALSNRPVPTLRKRGDLIYFGRTERPYNHVYRD